MKEVTHACKGIDRLGRDTIEIGGRVAEPLRHRAAHFEVELAVRVRGHIRIHAFDFALKGCTINRRCRHRSSMSGSYRAADGKPVSIG
jgi:hypothetical protein